MELFGVFFLFAALTLTILRKIKCLLFMEDRATKVLFIMQSGKTFMLLCIAVKTWLFGK